MAPSLDFVPAMSEIARQAGALLMTHFERRVAVEYKGDVDLVTVADRAAEELIVERIRSRWPRHDLVAEEGARSETGSDYRWYVDPLDGTTNFAHSFPVFCVSLGLALRGEVIAGVIYDPTRDELFAAEKGSGAWLNQRRIYVSKIGSLSESLLATGFPSHKRHKNPNIHFYHQITLRTHGVRRAGSAALDLACVASGRFEGFWEFNLSAWDVAAGLLLVQEAGGSVTDFSGSAVSVAEPKEVMASNGLLHHTLLREFAEIFAGRGLESIPSPAAYARDRQT
jgi:myo-inositol-1(or 4)-monophosphatase